GAGSEEDEAERDEAGDATSRVEQRDAHEREQRLHASPPATSPASRSSCPAPGGVAPDRPASRERRTRSSSAARTGSTATMTPPSATSAPIRSVSSRGPATRTV